jgi:hypothetical protein
LNPGNALNGAGITNSVAAALGGGTTIEGLTR